jgi:hypothetical protein
VIFLIVALAQVDGSHTSFADLANQQVRTGALRLVKPRVVLIETHHAGLDLILHESLAGFPITFEQRG